MIPHIPSRTQLIDWAKEMTKMEIPKIQSLSDGVVFCEIFNQIYPNSIPMSKLNTKAKSSFEKEKNLMVFFDAAFKLELPLHINLPQLSLGKAIQVLDTLRWLYRRYNEKKNGQNNSKSSFKEEPKMIKNYLGGLVTRTRKKSFYQNQTQDAQREKSVQKRSLSCGGSKLSQKLEEEGKKSRSRVSKLQNVIIQPPNEVHFLTGTEQLEKSSKKQKQQYSIKASKKKIDLTKLQPTQEALKNCLKKKKEEKSAEQVIHDLLNLHVQAIKSKMIRITNCVSEGNSQIQNKIKAILIQNDNKQPSQKNEQKSEQKIEQKKSIHQCSSDTFFSFNENTQQVQTDTLQNCQLQKKQEKLEYPSLLEDVENLKANQIPTTMGMHFSSNQNKKQNISDEKMLNLFKSLKINPLEKSQNQKSQLQNNSIKQISAGKETKSIRDVKDENGRKIEPKKTNIFCKEFNLNPENKINNEERADFRQTTKDSKKYSKNNLTSQQPVSEIRLLCSQEDKPCNQ